MEKTLRKLASLRSIVYRIGMDNHDSDRLTRYIYKRIVSLVKQGDFEDIESLYNSLASEIVNNPKSTFYIYGK